MNIITFQAISRMAFYFPWAGSIERMGYWRLITTTKKTMNGVRGGTRGRGTRGAGSRGGWACRASPFAASSAPRPGEGLAAEKNGKGVAGRRPGAGAASACAGWGEVLSAGGGGHRTLCTQRPWAAWSLVASVY